MSCFRWHGSMNIAVTAPKNATNKSRTSVMYGESKLLLLVVTWTFLVTSEGTTQTKIQTQLHNLPNKSPREH